MIRIEKITEIEIIEQVTRSPGPPGQQGLPGLNGTQGQAGIPGLNGTQGAPGANGTNIDPCVACLLDALAKLDSGALVVNVTANLERGLQGPSGDVNVTLPLVIDVDLATLLQAQLGETLGIGENATIFEICAAIDAEGLDIAAVINAIELDLDPIVTFQISQIVNQIAIAINEITGIPITPELIDEIIASIDIDDIVAQITANVQVSLEILEACLGQVPPPPPTTETLNVIKTTQCNEEEFENICDFDPQITVSGFNPTPNSFPASTTPTVVTLDPGEYNVDEQGFISALEACSALGFDGGQPVPVFGNIVICTNFSEDCSGDIGVGEEVTCNIENTVIETTVPRATLNVTKLVTCEDENGENSPSCTDLLGNITEDQFSIQVFGNSPDPSSSFPGSEAGTLVTLGSGDYQVFDTVLPEVFTDKAALGGNITGPIASFTGNCQQQQQFIGNGTIASGDSQTCNIENHFVIEETTETLNVIKNVDCQADAQTCEQNPIQPSNFTIVIEGNNPSRNNFPGSSGTGTNVALEVRPYNVTEQGFDSTTPDICNTRGFKAGSDLGENLFICTNFSEDCSGDISAGESLSCTIDNVVIDTTATLTVKKQVFGCDNIVPGQFEGMDCSGLQNNSSAPWLDCNNSNISNSIFCKSLPENIFDIEVLDDQNSQIQQFEGSEQGTTIPNLQPGTYTVNEIEQPELNFDNQLADDPTPNIRCSNQEFPDGGNLINTTAISFGTEIFYEICFEYEDEQGNDCNTLTLAAGEERTCTVKNYIGAAGPAT